MDQAPSMCDGQATRDLDSQSQQFGYVEASGLQALFKGYPPETLHRQEGDSGFFPDLIDGDHVLMLEGSGGARFTQKSLPRPGHRGRLGLHDFESDRAPEVRILG